MPQQLIHDTSITMNDLYNLRGDILVHVVHDTAISLLRQVLIILTTIAHLQMENMNMQKLGANHRQTSIGVSQHKKRSGLW